jgi:thiol-disulfide isomerase/thioredoxin
VLLNVWATWCMPCREEMPTLDRLQATLGGPGFEVVALSIDKGGLPVVHAFYQSLGIRFLKLYLDADGEATAGLVATGIPLTLLIDTEGREIGRKLGPAAWDDAAMVAQLRSHVVGNAPANPSAAAASR